MKPRESKSDQVKQIRKKMCDKAEGGDKPVEENSVSRSDLQEQRFQILKGLESFSRAMEPKLEENCYYIFLMIVLIPCVIQGKNHMNFWRFIVK